MEVLEREGEGERGCRMKIEEEEKGMGQNP